MEEWVRLFEETLNSILKISIQDSIFLRANLEAGDICDGRGVGGGAMRGVCIRRLAAKISKVIERSQANNDAPPRCTKSLHNTGQTGRCDMFWYERAVSSC